MHIDTERQTKRLAMHIGLMSLLLQRGAPFALIQQQCQSLRVMCKEIIDIEDETPNTLVQVEQLLPADVAEALAHGFDDVPDDLSGLEGETNDDA